MEWRDVWKNENIQSNNMSEISCKKFRFFLLDICISRHPDRPVKTINFSPTRKWASRENGAIRHSILRGVTPCDTGIGKPNERVEENIPSETAWCTNGEHLWVNWNNMEYHINLVGGFNPIEINLSNWKSSPNRRKIKNIWNHHLAMQSFTWMIAGEFLIGGFTGPTRPIEAQV